VHASSEDLSDNLIDSLCEELEQVFDHFSKYCVKILLANFNAQLGTEYVSKLTIGNDSLRRNSNDNDVGIVNFAMSKNVVFKSTMFLHQSILMYTC
jgi:hypothetical protein